MSLGSSEVLSKNAIKRLNKEKRWEEGREERIELRRKKRKESKKRKAELVALGIIQRKPRKRQDQVSSEIAVVIDCMFEDKMQKKEVESTSSQISLCYSYNRSAKVTVDMIVSSWGGETMNALKKRHAEYDHWKATFTEKDYKDAAISWLSSIHESTNREELLSHVVYLTADSPNVLDSLDSKTLYVIGGITDRNRYKNACFSKATLDGIKTVRLPIQEYVTFPGRKVLTINTVFNILLVYLATQDWGKAIINSVPKRANPKLIDRVS